jgi:hypothetical protein
MDGEIPMFFGLSGTGYGNLVDYFHDVSYNRVSVISDTVLGWVTAPFGSAALAQGPLAPASARAQRVAQCLNAVPASQLPDLSGFYGVVVINNAVQDGGACASGPITMTVNNKSFALACVWFDRNSLFTAFAAHEIGHGLNLFHSYDDSTRACGGQPGEYCDPWDIMSALGTFQFPDTNWLVSALHNNGPGLNAPGLLHMGWIPAANRREFQHEGGEQVFKLRALSRPRGSEPLVVVMDVGQTPDTSGTITVEYRQADGWDRGFGAANVPAAVLSAGGAVLVHRFNIGGTRTSTLMGGANRNIGALTPCRTLSIKGGSGLTFHVTVDSFDLADGSATVSVGFGEGPKRICVGDILSPGGIRFPSP